MKKPVPLSGDGLTNKTFRKRLLLLLFRGFLLGNFLRHGSLLLSEFENILTFSEKIASIT
jgi:hypothetical protein